PTQVCAGSTMTLTDGTPGGTWSSAAMGIATIGSTGVVTGVSAGVTTITYSLGVGCDVTTLITVNPLPATPVLTTSAVICVGSTATLTDASPGGTWVSGT